MKIAIWLMAVSIFVKLLAISYQLEEIIKLLTPK